MVNIQSNSQESLLTAKIRELVSSDKEATDIVFNTKQICNTRSLDFEKVATELLEALNSTTSIRNVAAFCRGVVNKLALTKKGLYEKKWKHPCFTSLHKAFKDSNINGELWELFLIDSVEEHALNEFNLNVEELIWTNRAIVTYCVANELTTFADFLTLLLKSKVLKDKNIPMVVLEKNAKENAAIYEELSKDFIQGDLYGED